MSNFARTGSGFVAFSCLVFVFPSKLDPSPLQGFPSIKIPQLPPSPLGLYNPYPVLEQP